MNRTDEDPADAVGDRLRIYTAPGEAADLQEMLDGDDVAFVEIGHIDELRSTTEPGVLFLSRGLLGVGGTLESLDLLPPNIVVVAADDGGRSAATQAGCLFLAAPELAPGDGPLLRALRSAGAHARVLAELHGGSRTGPAGGSTDGSGPDGQGAPGRGPG